MSLELWNTFATFGTFLVISATAIAAIAQLRHARGSNQIAAINELRETGERAEFRAAQHFVVTQLPEKLHDPAFRYQVVNRTARTTENGLLIDQALSLGNFYESMAILVSDGLVDRELALEIWNGIVVRMWEALVPFTAVLRRELGSIVWENFEYLTVISQDWLVAHSNGTYPAGMRRIDLKDDWLEADAHYAASLATA
jgi:Domain of unknown function (DUF4760)